MGLKGPLIHPEESPTMHAYRHLTLLFLPLLAFVVGLVGCAPRLVDDREVSLEAGDVTSISVPASTADQTVTITATSADVPIEVNVFLKEHEDEVERMLTLQKPTDKLLASATDSKSVSLQVAVPANQEALVRIHSKVQKPTTVTLRLRN